MAGGLKDKIRRIFRRNETEGDRTVFFGSDKYFIRNGRCLLEESISFFNGRTNPIRCLSVHELNTITVDYNCVSREDAGFKFYRSVWDGRAVLLKMYKRYAKIEGICRDIVVSTQMGVHANALKLLACCLETEFPVLVFEGPVYECLQDRLCKDENQGNQQQQQRLEWKDKLRIAYEVAYAATYLHTAFTRPIVHRELKPGNVFLDQDNVVKLTEFSFTVSIPEGKTHLEDEVVMGTWGYVAPEYLSFAKLAESSDVYSFGMLLLALFTEVSSPFLISMVRRALEDDLSDGREDDIREISGDDDIRDTSYARETHISESLDARENDTSEVSVAREVHVSEISEIAEYSNAREDDLSEFSNAREAATSEMLDAALDRNGAWTNKDLQTQLRASIELALRCMQKEPDNRPTMVDVATQLKNMIRSSESIASTSSQ